MPTTELNALTDEEVRILKEIVSRVKNRGVNLFRGEFNKADGEEQPAPDTYVVRLPTAGIPAAQNVETGTGTTDPTGIVQPGSALCQIFQTQVDELGIGRIVGVGTYIEVFNFSPSAAPDNLFALACKDKFGVWCLAEIYWEIAEC